MGRPKTKSKAQIYADTLAKLEEEGAKYEAIANKTTKTAINKLEKLGQLTAQANELEPFKDAWELPQPQKLTLRSWQKKPFTAIQKGLKINTLKRVL